MSFCLIGLGEVLWDLLPAGKQLGGAPANFAYHARALGGRGRIVSRVGDDELGHEILARLTQLGIPIDCIALDAAAATGTVSVEVLVDGQPRFTIHENVAWDRLAVEEKAREAVTRAHAVCFGTLAQRSEQTRRTIHELLASTAPDCLRVFDVNLRQDFYSQEVIEHSLRVANVLKVNEDELPLIAKMFGIGGEDRAQLTGMAARFDLRAIACTRGDRGSLLWSCGQWSDHPGLAAKVVDTVGAGDSFTAATTLGLLAGWDLDEVNDRANRVAAFVASCVGATPELPKELRVPFQKISSPSASPVKQIRTV